MPGPIVVGPFERLKPDAEKSTSPVFEGERDWQRSPTIRHLHEYKSFKKAQERIQSCFIFHNRKRPHQSVGYNTLWGNLHETSFEG